MILLISCHYVLVIFILEHAGSFILPTTALYHVRVEIKEFALPISFYPLSLALSLYLFLGHSVSCSLLQYCVLYQVLLALISILSTALLSFLLLLLP